MNVVYYTSSKHVGGEAFLLFVILVVSRILNIDGLKNLALSFFFLAFILFKSRNLHNIPFPIISLIILSVPILQTVAYGADGFSRNSIRITIMSIVFYAYGYYFYYDKGKEGCRSALFLMRDFMVASCIFGLIFQYVFHRAFASDTSVMAWSRRTSFVPFESVLLYGDSIWNKRMASCFSHPIIFANFLLVAIVVNERLERRRLIRIIFHVILLACLYLSKTRGAWLLLAGLFLAEIVQNARLQSLSAYGVILAIAVVPILFYAAWRSGLIEGMLNRFFELGNDNSYRQRAGGFVYLMDRLIQSPIRFFTGFGGGSGRAAIRQVVIAETDDWSTVDNQYLTVIYDFGFPVLVSYISLVARVSLHHDTRNDIVFNTLAVVGILLPLGNMVFFDLWYWNTCSYLFFGTAGFLSALIASKECLTGLPNPKRTLHARNLG